MNMPTSDLAFLNRLEAIVNERLQHPSVESYTSNLLQAGRKRIAQKIGEEGVELALAAAAGDQEEVVDEAADLVYHLIVLLADQGLTLGSIAERLQSRHADS